MQESAGGKVYQAPANTDERKDLFDALRDLNAGRFREFVATSIPDLYKTWGEKTDSEILSFMHMLRAQYVAMGEDFFTSRNYLRAKQFGYTDEQAAQKPLCGTCRWFREAPADEQKACVHLGSVPQDIACKSFEES
jgi:hypothetical protein